MTQNNVAAFVKSKQKLQISYDNQTDDNPLSVQLTFRMLMAVDKSNLSEPGLNCLI